MIGETGWTGRARAVSRALGAETAGRAGTAHSVYVVLLHDSRGPGRWGLYVGQTSREPDLRFDQHRAGYKSSRAVRRFGVRLLPELVAHLNPMMGWEAVDLEATLADAFREAGIAWVEGGH